MTDTTEPRCFTWDALVEIRSLVDEVQDAHSFFVEADRLLDQPDSTLALPFATGGLPSLTTDGDRRQYEPDNAANLYASLGAMPPVAGADSRLWTWLALGPYRQYMMERWSPLETRNWRGRLNDRWLLPAGTSTTGKLIRHGLSRLWWLADLTHQPSALTTPNHDEWHYLRLALSSEDIVLAIFDRETGAIPALRFALLDQIALWEGGAERIRSLMKEVTLTYGYKDLTYLSRADATQLVAELTTARYTDDRPPAGV